MVCWERRPAQRVQRDGPALHDSVLLLVLPRVGPGSTLLSSQGCQQGDVFASFLFCLVVRAIHLRAAKVKKEREAQWLPVWERDVWYLDDNLCFGKWDGVAAFFHFL